MNQQVVRTVYDIKVMQELSELSEVKVLDLSSVAELRGPDLLHYVLFVMCHH